MQPWSEEETFCTFSQLNFCVCVSHSSDGFEITWWQKQKCFLSLITTQNLRPTGLMQWGYEYVSEVSQLRNVSFCDAAVKHLRRRLDVSNYCWHWLTSCHQLQPSDWEDCFSIRRFSSFRSFSSFSVQIFLCWMPTTPLVPRAVWGMWQNKCIGLDIGQLFYMHAVRAGGPLTIICSRRASISISLDLYLWRGKSMTCTAHSRASNRSSGTADSPSISSWFVSVKQDIIHWL